MEVFEAKQEDPAMELAAELREDDKLRQYLQIDQLGPEAQAWYDSLSPDKKESLQATSWKGKEYYRHLINEDFEATSARQSQNDQAPFPDAAFEGATDTRPNRHIIRTRRNLLADMLERRAENINARYLPAITVTLVELLEWPRHENTGFLSDRGLVEILAELTGDNSHQHRRELTRSVRRFQRALIEGCHELGAPQVKAMTHNVVESLREVHRRISLLTPNSIPGTSDAPLRVSPKLLALVLNAVRGAAERSIPAGHTPGVTDTDVDAIEASLLELGSQLQTDKRSPANVNVQDDLRAFLRVLNDYDPSDLQHDLAIVRLGTRLLIALGGGPEGFWGVFGTLNVYRTLDPVLSHDEFMNAMNHIGQAAERLASDRAVQRMVTELNAGVPEDERIPNSRRLASFCAGNRLMAACDAAIGGKLPIERTRELVQMARQLTERVAETDRLFEAIPWYWLALGTAEAEVLNDPAFFTAGMKRIAEDGAHDGGLKAALLAASRIRMHFFRRTLQQVLDARIRALVIAGWLPSPDKQGEDKQT